MAADLRSLPGVDAVTAAEQVAAAKATIGGMAAATLYGAVLLFAIGGVLVVFVMALATRERIRETGQALNGLPQAELTRFRRRTVGYVLQSFNLVPNLTALENVALPMEFAGTAKAVRTERARSLLGRFGLGQRLKHHPRELSGGEMQRVAIARALANEPRLVLADEPIGNLDSRSGQLIYELQQGIARERTVIVVIHAEDLARLADRVLHIRDRRLLDATAEALNRARPAGAGGPAGLRAS